MERIGDILTEEENKANLYRIQIKAYEANPTANLFASAPNIGNANSVPYQQGTDIVKRSGDPTLATQTTTPAQINRQDAQGGPGQNVTNTVRVLKKGTNQTGTISKEAFNKAPPGTYELL